MRPGRGSGAATGWTGGVGYGAGTSDGAGGLGGSPGRVIWASSNGSATEAATAVPAQQQQQQHPQHDGVVGPPAGAGENWFGARSRAIR
ncbi:hypothetical protein [Ruania alba]|uniref:hypothetical protein n=1 Tax=Ruania alba TaxID=648782 RepID=UPI0011141CEE|nr:hypothetical protein [Ruania alba]